MKTIKISLNSIDKVKTFVMSSIVSMQNSI